LRYGEHILSTRHLTEESYVLALALRSVGKYRLSGYANA